MKKLILADEPELICTSAHHEPQVICEECREDYRNAIPITPEILLKIYQRAEEINAAGFKESWVDHSETSALRPTGVSRHDIAAALEEIRP